MYAFSAGVIFLSKILTVYLKGFLIVKVPVICGDKNCVFHFKNTNQNKQS